MTLHIAVTGPGFGMLLSDSQGSTLDSEFHGWQKQVARDGFLFGCAGQGLILGSALAFVGALEPTEDPFTAVERFMEEEVQPAARAGSAFIAVGGDPIQARVFHPGALKHWCGPSRFESIGSGSTFVRRAMKRDRALNINNPLDGIVDAFLWCVEYARSADESLTVDDRYLISCYRAPCLRRGGELSSGVFDG